MTACSHGIIGACPICAAVNAQKAAEAELREVAGHLEGVRAEWKKSLGDRERVINLGMAQAGLMNEARALLERATFAQHRDAHFAEDVGVWLEKTRLGARAFAAQYGDRQRDLEAELRGTAAELERVKADRIREAHGFAQREHELQRTLGATITLLGDIDDDWYGDMPGLRERLRAVLTGVPTTPYDPRDLEAIASDALGLWQYWKDHDITESDDDWAEFTHAVYGLLEGRPVPKRWLGRAKANPPPKICQVFTRDEPAAPGSPHCAGHQRPLQPPAEPQPAPGIPGPIGNIIGGLLRRLGGCGPGDQ